MSAKGKVILQGERTYDDWEQYIAQANVESAIVERGKRWREFYDWCKEHHGKQGGSMFRQFAEQRFGMTRSTASRWVAIGRGDRELLDNIQQFAPDYRAMYDWLRLSEPQKNQ